MVLSCLSLTTTPWSWRFGISKPLFRLRLRLRTRGALPRCFGFCFGRRRGRHRHGAGALLRGDGLDPGDVAAHGAHPRRILELAGRPLEAQVEPLLLELQELVVELVDAHRPDIGWFHRFSSYSAMRSTKRVLIGSLAAARSSASLAVVTDTPSTSKMMRPGLMRVTQYSGVPLPEPMRTSSGFFDTGTSGNTRIQTRPARFMWRVSARRAASSWRAVTRSGSSALSPNWPKARL